LKIELLDPFVDGVYATLNETLRCKASPGPMSLLGPAFYTSPVNVAVRVKGPVEGSAVYSMSSETAQELTGRLTGVRPNGLGPELGKGLSDLGAMWVERASQGLRKMGLTCEMGGVIVFHGLNVQYFGDEPALAAPVETDAGRVDVSVAVRDGR